MALNWQRIGQLVVNEAVKALRSKARPQPPEQPQPGQSGPDARPGSPRRKPQPQHPDPNPRAQRDAREDAQRAENAEDASPGQFGPDRTRDIRAAEARGLRTSYAPDPDGTPDPGEVVWTWVPYVEQDGRGKDRPVLILGRIDADTVVGCYMTTKDHDGYVDMGAGAWDSKGRTSYLNPERLLRITDAGMRREGSIMPRERFDRAVDAMLREHPDLR